MKFQGLPDALSPLFKTYGSTVARRAERELGNTTIGRFIKDVNRVRRMDFGQYPDRLGQLCRRYGKLFEPSRMARELTGTSFGQLVSNIEKYAKGTGVEAEIISQFLDAMGPTGKLIKGITASAGKGLGAGIPRDIESLSKILRAFGYETLPPPARRHGTMATRGEAAAIEYLQNLGYQVIPPPDDKVRRATATGMRPMPFGISPYRADGQIRKTIDLPMASGATRRFKVDDPIVTGDMVVCHSSNVHSYGYDVENAYLYIRFLDTHENGERFGPGPVYRYSNVEPELFVELCKKESKGKWIWDRLRNRGTVSGHKKKYELVGIVRNYVPRQAELREDGEYYASRRILTNKGRWLSSLKPEVLVRPLRPLGPADDHRNYTRR